MSDVWQQCMASASHTAIRDVLANREPSPHSFENIVNKEIVVPSGVRVRFSEPSFYDICRMSWPNVHPFMPIQGHFRPRTIFYTYSLDDWKIVRFSYEVHFEPGSQRKLRIVSKSGQHLCQDYIEEQHQPEEKDEKIKANGEKFWKTDWFNARALTWEELGVRNSMRCMWQKQ